MEKSSPKEKKKKVDWGKKFEADWKKSVPEHLFYQRLKDDTMKFAKVSNRFDCIMFDKPRLFLFELKSHMGKSIPFSVIRDEQMNGLFEANKQEGVTAGFIFNFRDCDNETYFLGVNTVKAFVDSGTRKSFPLDWCRRYGLSVDCMIARTRFSYNIRGLLDQLLDWGEEG